MNDAAKDAAASNPPSGQGESKPPTSEPSGQAPAPGETSPAEHRASSLRPPWPKGVSGNPKGRPAGIPSLNAELREAALKLKIGDKSYLEALLVRSLESPKLGVKLLDKLFGTITPEEAGVVVHNSFEGLLETLRARRDEAEEPEDFRTPVKDGEVQA